MSTSSAIKANDLTNKKAELETTITMIISGVSQMRDNLKKDFGKVTLATIKARKDLKDPDKAALDAGMGGDFERLLNKLKGLPTAYFPLYNKLDSVFRACEEIRGASGEGGPSNKENAE